MTRAAVRCASTWSGPFWASSSTTKRAVSFQNLLLLTASTTRPRAKSLSATQAVGVGLILPVLVILSCLYLIYYLPPTSWLRFAAWLNFGFVIYVGYGSVHSRLTGREHADRPAEHDARTAYTGAWLAVIGIALLVFMRGFDVWLEALKTHEDLNGGSKILAALGDVLKTAPWMEVSWFLIVPLALNAFVLCPIVIRRALKAGREGGGEGQAGITSSSLIVAIVLLAVKAGREGGGEGQAGITSSSLI